MNLPCPDDPRTAELGEVACEASKLLEPHPPPAALPLRTWAPRARPIGAPAYALRASHDPAAAAARPRARAQWGGAKRATDEWLAKPDVAKTLMSVEPGGLRTGLCAYWQRKGGRHQHIYTGPIRPPTRL